MQLLNKAKGILINRVTDMFIDRREDLDLKEYPAHFSEMGELIARIDNLKTLSSLVEMIEANQLSQAAVFDDEVEDFLESLINR